MLFDLNMGNGIPEEQTENYACTTIEPSKLFTTICPQDIENIPSNNIQMQVTHNLNELADVAMIMGGKLEVETKIVTEDHSAVVTAESSADVVDASEDDDDIFGGSDLSSLGSYETMDESSPEKPKKKSAKRKRGSPSLSKRSKKQALVDVWQDEEVQVMPGLPDKNFLRAGLYSIDYKLSTEELAEFKNDNVLTQVKHEGRRFLPLPVNFGEWYLKQQKEFYVPYDIMFSQARQPKSYTKIRNNLFIERKRRHDDHTPRCECKLPADGSPGCLDDCINRLTFIECNPNNCPCGSQCSNQAFQKKQFLKDLVVFYAGEGSGFGMKTMNSIQQGTLLIEYVGEVISSDLLAERVETIYKNQQCLYFLDYANGEVVDGGLKGNEARFVNHSCDPNCHIEKWHVDGEICVGIFASRNIAANEEITYDYNWHSFGEKRMECFCGSENCRGWVGKSNEYKDEPSGSSVKKTTSKTYHGASSKTTKIKVPVHVSGINENGHKTKIIRMEIPGNQKFNWARSLGANNILVKRAKFDKSKCEKMRQTVSNDLFMLRNVRWLERELCQSRFTFTNAKKLHVPKKSLSDVLNSIS